MALLRVALLLGGLALLPLVAIFYFRAAPAVALWPWPDGRLTFIFIASIQAAIAAAMLWVAWARDWAGLAAGALNLIVMQAGLAGALAIFGMQQGQPLLWAYAAACALFALANVGLFIWAHRLPVPAPIATPRLVRISFAAFCAVLLIVGAALILGLPNVMPWPPNPQSSAVIGWIFFGDAFYFGYALLRPAWQNARAQLWSFLAYDAVLLGPLALHWRNVQPEHQASLAVYLSILVYSLALAVFYLFIRPPRAAQAPDGALN